MRRRGFALAAMLAATWPGAVGAERVVRYDIDEATAAHDAAEQGLPLTPLPQRGSVHAAVRIAPAVDHAVIRAGINCSAWKVSNPVSVLLTRFLTAWDSAGAPFAADGTATLTVSIDRAVTVNRCFGTGEFKSKCTTRVSIDGSTATPGAAPQPFHVEREATTNGVGICAGLTRGIGLVSREAAGALIEQLDRTAR